MSLSFLPPEVLPNPSSHHSYTILFLPAVVAGFSSYGSPSLAYMVSWMPLLRNVQLFPIACYMNSPTLL